jgi:hypothetical protein
MDKMTKWLRDYDLRRTEGSYSSNKSRLSTRFDLENMSWEEIKEIEIPELTNPKTGEHLNWGEAIEALRKSWYSYKRYRKDGFPPPDLAFRILYLQRVLGLPLSEFEELERFGGSEWVENELKNVGGDDSWVAPFRIRGA